MNGVFTIKRHEGAGKLLNNTSNPSVDRPRWRPNKVDTRRKAEINENLPTRNVVEFAKEVREAYERGQSSHNRRARI